MCLCSVQGSALQSPEESTVLPLSLFCLLSVQCRAPRTDAMVWRWCPSLCTDLGGVLVCSAVRPEEKRGARGRRRGSTQGSIRATTKSRPLLEPLPSPLPAPPSCTGCKLNLIRGSLPSQSYFTFAHPSLDIHLRNRGQY